MEVQSLRVDGKTIVLTGGYGYLGIAIAKSLAFHGANVIVTGRSILKFKERVFTSEIKFVELDVSKRASISKAYREIYDTYGRIDVIINNAYYSKGQSPETMSDEDWNHGIDGVLSSVFRSITEIIPYYKTQGFGKIINISSIYGIVAPDFKIYNDSPDYLNPPHYGAAKAGVLQLTRYYASYLGKLNIQVNSVTPGPFPSKSVQENKSFITELKQHTALSRIGNPEDLAGVFTFLSSEAANFITGQNFIIDGGWTTK
jgi:NAD(P)-dependent dehydrogenase (short-subunit alcohol dehydrogenase family)